MSDNNTPTKDDATIELTQKYERERERANNALGKLTDLEKKLEQFNGIDLVKLKADSEALTLLMKDKAKNSGDKADIDAVISAAEKKVREELQPLLDKESKEKQTLSTQLKELRVVDGVYSQIGNAFNDDMQEFIKQIIRDNVDLDADGNYIIKGKDGKPRYSPAAANKIMTINEFADELQNKFPSAVRSTVPAGMKQNGERKLTGDLTVDRYLKMSESQRAQIPQQERFKLARLATNGRAN